jgi:hypothetical protein
MRIYLLLFAFLVPVFFYGPDTLLAQQKDYRPPLFFREDWKEIPAAVPVTREHISNSELELRLYGPGKDSIKKSHHDQPADDPYYIWSGLCTGTWAVSLRNKGNYADMSGYARIIWRSKQSGFRNLRIILRLADGSWLVSDQCDGSSNDWRIREFIVSDINWYSLDMVTITEGTIVKEPDLSRVDEIGFTDLMRGGSSQACSRLDWIEVYARKIKR